MQNTFKTAVLTENIDNTVFLPQEYSHDQLKDILSRKPMMTCHKIDKKTLDLQTFLDHHMYELFDLMNELKERYCLQGIMNNMTYADMIDIVKACVTVLYTDDDMSEDDVDDDYDETHNNSKSEQL